MSFLDENTNGMLPCVLLLDTSMSMSTEITQGFTRISSLNGGTQVFRDEIQGDKYASHHVEIAVISVGGSQPELRQDWVIAKDFLAPALSASGTTPLGEAFINAVDLCEKRKRHYMATGTDYYRPWIIIISDGQPTSSPDVWKRAVQLADTVKANKKATIITVAIDGCPVDKLSQLSTFPTTEMSSHSFSEFFLWLSKSITNASKSGDDLQQGYTQIL